MSRRLHLIPALLAAALLFTGAADQSHSYAQTLRGVVFACAIVLAWFAWERKARWIIPFMIGAAVLWNPISTIAMGNEAMQGWSILGGAFFLAAALGIGPAVPPKRPANVIAAESAERIKSLQRLRDDGIISRDEYDQKLAAITGSGTHQTHQG